MLEEDFVTMLDRELVESMVSGWHAPEISNKAHTTLWHWLAASS